MKASILSSEHFLTAQWSGGSSTQLYIFPTKATYAERNFAVRISTAKVEVAESTFTNLPGVNRTLMILEGEISISHNGQYSKHLKAFDVAAFSGDWKTTAIGTCIDFNVMCTGQLQCNLYHVSMGPKSNYTLKPEQSCNNLFLYVTSGTIYLQLMRVDYMLETGNFMVIENHNNSSICINSPEAFGVVVVEIY